MLISSYKHEMLIDKLFLIELALRRLKTLEWERINQWKNQAQQKKHNNNNV